MTWSPGRHEDGTCSCHPSSVQSVHQTLDEMDFERGIWNAALNGDLEGVKRHVLSCGRPNEPDPFGYTALHYASRNGHYDTCLFLLGHGASCNVRTHGGATPLHRAAYCGHRAIVELLLDHGADPAAKDDDGKTCLHKAAENGHQELCELILERHPQLRPMQDNSQRRAGDLVPAKNEGLRKKLLDL
ncbi:ankyrin repeat domain-containing protein 39 [Pseudonaja textilis]|uniref:Ankyrin repeat domain 39 n=1 Tax=Pseudonaja textilis TaxID=8673 RepID=A0A670ZAL0_PSETE|nr:ankyrin repeat domain-containing protein 39 [Pseudonaja textilis]XP_026571073.1 ankyrin repeat domain-containing protein 39 [Pseudonaja textilis]XP_026571074.1 ankyrin repeat domain-containing protein 39 [Pseudonaja textilis]XP_026571075.1 ankyrin repeat domain-containing protein 39 [Pseudonaja textilis]